MSTNIAQVHVTGESYTCKSTIGGGGDIHYKYRLNNNNHYVIESAAVSIYKKNIDTGSTITESTTMYAHKLNDFEESFVAGMILSDKFGGFGSEPANIFPQSINIQQTIYNQYENRIKRCIQVSGDSSSVLLSWEFRYRELTNTRPYQIYYTANFQGDSKCRSTSMTFDN